MLKENTLLKAKDHICELAMKENEILTARCNALQEIAHHDKMKFESKEDENSAKMAELKRENDALRTGYDASS